MAQSSMTDFFTSRKRPAASELKSKSKVVALDTDVTIAGYVRSKTHANASKTPVCIKLEAAVVPSQDEGPKEKSQAVSVTSASKPRTPARATRRATKSKDSKQSDLKSFLQTKTKPDDDSPTDPGHAPPITSETGSSDAVPEGLIELAVKCMKKDECPVVGTTKKELAFKETTDVEVKTDGPSVKEDSSEVSEAPQARVELDHDRKDVLVQGNLDSALNTPAIVVSNVTPTTTSKAKATQMLPSDRKESSIDRARKELSLGDIKSKLTRSARLAELKASMARYDEGRKKLNQIEKAKQNQGSSLDVPQLNEFASIELDIPVSPAKSPMKSPMKSPLKSLIGSRSPAFQRYSSLAVSGEPSLTLPSSYRHLAELFRCLDTVASLLFNRKEIITFKKLQPAVQEMSRKTFTLNHVAQMVTVFPNAFTLKQEKVHNFGTPSKQDKYQLVMEPVVELSSSDDGGAPSMTPSVLLERRRKFYHKLLEIVKKHHQEFLQSLDPPLTVPLGSLTRWHPEFAVDEVPDVVPTPLPQPPNLDKCFSAKDVLAKARDLYSCNSRMEKALQSVANASSGIPLANVNVEGVDPPAPTNTQQSPSKSLQLASALKGIPKALLEKIRARQAAKAMEAMTRTSAQCKEASQYSRLPELARILRNVFVAEKKGALPLEIVLEKVGNSYRSTLSPKDLEEHLRLIAKSVPGWISFEHLLKTDYLRLSKKADMNRVMKRLDDLASSKQS